VEWGGVSSLHFVCFWQRQLVVWGGMSSLHFLCFWQRQMVVEQDGVSSLHFVCFWQRQLVEWGDVNLLHFVCSACTACSTAGIARPARSTCLALPAARAPLPVLADGAEQGVCASLQQHVWTVQFKAASTCKGIYTPHTRRSFARACTGTHTRKSLHLHTHMHASACRPFAQVGMLAEEMAVSQSGGPPMPLTVVFVERKAKCDEVAHTLCQERIPAAVLHGGLVQVGMARTHAHALVCLSAIVSVYVCVNRCRALEAYFARLCLHVHVHVRVQPVVKHPFPNTGCACGCVYAHVLAPACTKESEWVFNVFCALACAE